MKHLCYFLLILCTTVACCHETKEDKYEEDEEILVDGRPAPEDMAFFSIVYNNGWEGLWDPFVTGYYEASPEEKLKGIELGKELYAHHFYEIIDTTNMKFEHKADLEKTLHKDSTLYYQIAYYHKNKKRIFVLFDHKGHPIFYTR